MKRCIPLEPAAEAVCDQSSVPPLIFQMPPKHGRRALEEMQDMPIYKCPADISSVCVNTGIWGSVPVYFIVPGGKKIKNIIFYIHGGGWVLGSFHTHEKLVRELSARTDSLVVFPEYSRSPEAKYPTAIEQCYFLLSHMGNHRKLFSDGKMRCAYSSRRQCWREYGNRYGSDVIHAAWSVYSQAAVILSGNERLF